MSRPERLRKLWMALLALGASAIVLALVLALLDSGSTPPAPGRVTGASPIAVTPPPPSAATASSTTAAAPPARPAPRTQQFGASVNWLFNTANPSQEIDVQLQALRATGATLARTDALWEASEPHAPIGGVHRFDWTLDDTVAGELAAHHLRWLPILDYSAPWAQSVPGQDHSPPTSTADYADYSGAFATRYGTGGTFWRAHPELPAEPVQTYEIWNEPDSGVFWVPTPDAARYAELYAAARVAIIGADPGARVIVGGLTNPSAFLPAMLTAQPSLRGHIDGVAIHPYGTPAVVLEKIRADRAVLVALGMPDVPLYATEYGWTTAPPGALDYVPAARRPGYIFRTTDALGHLDCGLAASLLYTWYTPQGDPSNPQDWFGVDGLTGASTADAAAFARGLRRARAPGPALALCG